MFDITYVRYMAETRVAAEMLDSDSGVYSDIKSNFEKLLRLLQSSMNASPLYNSTKLSFHTTVSHGHSEKRQFIAWYNNMLRGLSDQMDSKFLFDYDYEVWSSVLFDRRVDSVFGSDGHPVLRDGAHPSRTYTLMGALKVLQLSEQYPILFLDEWK